MTVRAFGFARNAYLKVSLIGGLKKAKVLINS
jgi:hypothetical protein